MIEEPLDEKLNDPRIESVEQYFPATVETYALYSETEDKHPGSFWKDRIHFWAKVRLVEGGIAFVGLTLFNLQNSSHAEHESPNQFFVSYTDDPNT